MVRRLAVLLEKILCVLSISNGVLWEFLSTGIQLDSIFWSIVCLDSLLHADLFDHYAPGDISIANTSWLQTYKHLSSSLGSINYNIIQNCLAQTLYNHILYIFPLSVAHWYWRPVDFPLAAPELPKVLLDVAACLLIFDFQYFVWHLLHHKVPWLYRTFHKVHKYTATFALTTDHSGAWETLSLGFFAALSPAILNCHPLTSYLFFIVNIWLSVEDHSGYDFPWSTHRLVPFGLYGGAPHHDLHHMKFKTNYAPYFTHWDRLLGTYSTLHKKSH
ncbi:cholesterol 25-hydroxylase-like protein [Hypanus sabinus]|uniref:cholesterol 25-hydroxylase-like protein n=1 Tax=Hypanus sabinus TaxID=79690 RepID=UPI0028C47D2F|nr:cholesterol 25-hydroxylase-like protein [Hypanus sabinus]